MFFPRIDVKEWLLRGDGTGKSGRQIAQVDIDLSSAKTSDAHALLEKSLALSEHQLTDGGEVLYDEAIKRARGQLDALTQAAAMMLQTILLDAIRPEAFKVSSLAKALKILEFELWRLRQRLSLKLISEEEAERMIAPRQELLNLILENFREFKLSDESSIIAKIRLDVDRHLALGQWLEASQLAEEGAEEAVHQFGEYHWWNAVMLTRQATALVHLHEVEDVRPLVVKALEILSKWDEVLDSCRGDVFKIEKDILAALTTTLTA